MGQRKVESESTKIPSTLDDDFDSDAADEV